MGANPLGGPQRTPRASLLGANYARLREAGNSIGDGRVRELQVECAGETQKATRKGCTSRQHASKIRDADHLGANLDLHNSVVWRIGCPKYDR